MRRRPRPWTGLVSALLSMGSVAATAPGGDAGRDLWGGRRVFAARLTADYQPMVTNSTGVGAVRIVLDLASRRAEWQITYSGLTSAPIAIGLHGPAQPGTNGAQLINLGGKSLSSPIRGSTIIPAGQIQYMLLGWTYVLVSTSRYPEGELRGKVDVVSPEHAADLGAPPVADGKRR